MLNPTKSQGKSAAENLEKMLKFELVYTVGVIIDSVPSTHLKIKKTASMGGFLLTYLR